MPVRPSVARAKLHELVASLPPCVIGMEACSGAHHWARLFAGHGHTVKLMAPKLVAPYRMSGKRGKNAAAICESVQRPARRFVPVKSEEQQSQLMVHRARQGFVVQRTATINRIRGLLSEFGIVLPQEAEVVRREAARHPEDLPGYANTVIGDLLAEVHLLDERIKQYDAHIHCVARDSAAAKRLMQLRGLGETSPRRMHAWRGPCSPRVSPSGCRPLGHPSGWREGWGNGWCNALISSRLPRQPTSTKSRTGHLLAGLIPRSAGSPH